LTVWWTINWLHIPSKIDVFSDVNNPLPLIVSIKLCPLHFFSMNCDLFEDIPSDIYDRYTWKCPRLLLSFYSSISLCSKSMRLSDDDVVSSQKAIKSIRWIRWPKWLLISFIFWIPNPLVIVVIIVVSLLAWYIYIYLNNNMNNYLLIKNVPNLLFKIYDVF